MIRYTGSASTGKLLILILILSFHFEKNAINCCLLCYKMGAKRSDWLCQHSGSGPRMCITVPDQTVFSPPTHSLACKTKVIDGTGGYREEGRGWVVWRCRLFAKVSREREYFIYQHIQQLALPWHQCMHMQIRTPCIKGLFMQRS